MIIGNPEWESSEFTAADLLVLLESMRDRNIPLHKVKLYIECEDSHYDGVVITPPVLEDATNTTSGLLGRILCLNVYG